MKTRNPVLATLLLGFGLLAFSTAASAHDYYDRHDGYEHRYERDHGYHYGHYGRDVRVIERRYVVREVPRRYYEPVYERRAPIYRAEPGVVVSIGLPPIIIPFR